MSLHSIIRGASVRVVGAACLTFAAAAAALPPVPVEPNRAAEIPASVQATGIQTYLLELEAEPAAVVFRQATGGVARPSAAALSRARGLTRDRVAQVEAAQRQVLSRLEAGVPNARVLYRASKAMNGIVIEADASTVETLRALPGVKRVLPVEREIPSTSTSVPFTEAEKVWDGLGFGVTGQGIRVGIIDSGIDYQHPDLGGTGLLADYQANNRTITSETGGAAFPTARVVGGIDFVGDAYGSAGQPAVPDSDPMDCLGHGTHVATIAAGGGVNADGTPYTGPWDASTNFNAMRIGPGTAPQADLYSIRVFGCSGSTAFAAAGINWAMDPNGDNDLSDHLDVVNLSLGSSYGGLSSSTTIAAENASAIGMIMVMSAGNSADTFTITGSPGVATRAISVANISDSGGTGVNLQVNSPASIAGRYIAANSAITGGTPPVPAGQTGNLVRVAGNAPGPAVPIEGCGTLTNAAAIAGNVAFVRRGNCNFNLKVENAQNAGAIGVVLFDNAVGDPSAPGMGGAFTPGFVPTIPMISTSNQAGVLIENALINGDTVSVTFLTADAGGAISVSSSRGPRYEDLAPKPDVAAPGNAINAAQTGVTCLTGGGCISPDSDGFIPGGQVLNIGGTSMAAPHVAGIAALLRQLYPTRSNEEIKANIMNGALKDVFLGAGETGGRISTSRAGAGRANALNSASLDIEVFNADNSGLVSVGFDPEIIGNAVQTRELRFVNHGNTAATLGLAFDVVKDSPGVAFDVQASVQVPANGSVTVPVQLQADASAMRHPRDTASSPTQTPAGSLAGLGALGRHWISEESALLVVSQGGAPIARLPVYVAPRASSQMSVPSVIDTAGQATGSAPLPYTGTGLCSATIVATPGGPACTGNGQDALSITSAFELQHVSPRDPGEFDYNDIRYVGVSTQPAGTTPAQVRHIFAIGTYGVWQSPYGAPFVVEVDLNNDGVVDNTIGNGDPGTLGARLFANQIDGQDSNLVLRLTSAGSVASVGYTELFDPRTLDMRLQGNNVMFLHANRSTLGLAADTTPFRYRVRGCFAAFPFCPFVLAAAITDSTPWITYNPGARGITFTPWLNDDQPGGSATMEWNTANLQANGSLGALVFHHHNDSGTTQQVVTLGNTNIDVANDAADVEVSLSVDNASPALGSTVRFTLGASHAGPNATADIQALFQLPAGLAYDNDSSGGDYDPNTGVWTLPAAASGAPASITVDAVVERSGPIDLEFTAMGNLPDPDMSNNDVSLGIAAANTADISVDVAVTDDSILANENATFTVTVSNAGPDSAFSVDVTHDLPNVAVTPVGTPSAGTYDAASHTWTLASLASGQSETLQLVYTGIQVAGSFTQAVTASHDDNDPTQPNTDTVDLVVSPAALDELVVVAGTPQSAIVGAAFATAFTVRAEDAYDNRISGLQVTFAAPAAGASGTFAGPATVTTNASGIASAPNFTANSIAGNYLVTASAGGEQALFSLSNLRHTTTTTLAAMPTTANLNQSVTLTATVVNETLAAVNTGTVDFSVNGVDLCADVAVSATGTAQCVTSFATAGVMTVRADYGQTDSNSASFATRVVTVVRPTPTVVLSVANIGQIRPNTSVTLNAQVSGANGTPTGTVDFIVHGTLRCDDVVVTAGTASCTFTAGAQGDYVATANYSGDATYLPASDQETLQIRADRIFANGFEN